MKKLCYIATAVLVCFHLMTAVVGWPGGNEYLLVVKPYPSLLKTIPNMEALTWEAAVRSGEIPTWLANGEYFVLGRGSHELEARMWERAYSLSIFCAIAGLMVSFVLFIRGLVKACSSKQGAGANAA